MLHFLLPDLHTLLQALLYLIPSAIIWLLLTGLSGRTALYSILSLPGTFLHELLHLTAGIVTNAQPVSFSLLPKRDRRGKLILGSASFANIRWYNALPTALAPLLGIYITLLAAAYRVDGGYAFKPADIIIWCLLAPQFTSMWPSSTDWKISFKSWPLYLFGAVLLMYEFDPRLLAPIV
jgi:hypothetical protein